jgi:hypothetical protein
MDSIKKVCRYDPEIVFEEATEHANKVEFLVHRHLHKHRRREILISGACNSGKGCRHVHTEWFDVSSDLASFVVSAWVRWMSNSPYNENGYLKPIWIEQVKFFNWNWRSNIWNEWTNSTVSEDKRRAVTEVLITSIKNEDEKELDTKLALVTTIEVKPDDD